MQTKLTLRLEDALVRRAKAYARRKGKSVSAMVADFFTLLDSTEEMGAASDLTPTVRSLLGSCRGQPLDEEHYRRHLREKHF